MKTLGLGITAKLKHGALLKLVRQFGSQAALARELGINQQEMGRIINLQVRPPDNDRWALVVAKLEALTGQSQEDLFPEVIDDEAFQAVPKQLDVHKDVPLDRLLPVTRSLMLASPEEEMIEQEIVFENSERLQEALSTLPDRYKRILIARFGLDGEEPRASKAIADQFQIGTQRLHQIEHKAIAKLRQKLGEPITA